MFEHKIETLGKIPAGTVSQHSGPSGNGAEKVWPKAKLFRADGYGDQQIVHAIRL